MFSFGWNLSRLPIKIRDLRLERERNGSVADRHSVNGLNAMSFKRMKPFWIGGVLFGVLFSIRLDLYRKTDSSAPLPSGSPASAPSKRDRWMNIFQNGRTLFTVKKVHVGKFILNGAVIQKLFCGFAVTAGAKGIHFYIKGHLTTPFLTLSACAEVATVRALL